MKGIERLGLVRVCIMQRCCWYENISFRNSSPLLEFTFHSLTSAREFQTPQFYSQTRRDLPNGKIAVNSQCANQLAKEERRTKNVVDPDRVTADFDIASTERNEWR